jgi:Cu-Zn family superoxide dismutase
MSQTRKNKKNKKVIAAVAVIKTNKIEGTVVAKKCNKNLRITAIFTKLPAGKHGFHIHDAGDLRGEGCNGLCSHYDKGHNEHGGAPSSNKNRHTGDLGNIQMHGKKTLKRTFTLSTVKVSDLWGRSIIVHEDEDDLGKGPHEDSKITGHSGKRIGCAIFGRASC